MDTATYISIAALASTLLNALIVYVSRNAVRDQITKEQADKSKQIYLEHLELKKRVDTNMEHFNDYKGKTSVETGILATNMNNIKETLDKMEVSFKEFTKEIQELVRTIKR